MSPLARPLTVAQFLERRVEKKAKEDLSTSEKDHITQMIFHKRIAEAMDQGNTSVPVYIPFHQAKDLPEKLSGDSMIGVKQYLARTFVGFTIEIEVMPRQYRTSWTW